MSREMPTAEEQLDIDKKTVAKGKEKIREMENKRKLFGGGKNHMGFLNEGVSDEQLSAEKKETEDYDKMANQQYLLRKRREYK